MALRRIHLFFAFQVQTIVSDNKCQELWQFLRRHRSEVSFTRQDIIKYRRKAEQHVGTDDNLYRVEWVRLCIVALFLGQNRSRCERRNPRTNRCTSS